MKKIVWIPLLILGILLLVILILILAAPHLLFSYMFSAPSRSTKVPDRKSVV